MLLSLTCESRVEDAIAGIFSPNRWSLFLILSLKKESQTG